MKLLFHTAGDVFENDIVIVSEPQTVILGPKQDMHGFPFFLSDRGYLVIASC